MESPSQICEFMILSTCILRNLQKPLLSFIISSFVSKTWLPFLKIHLNRYRYLYNRQLYSWSRYKSIYLDLKMFQDKNCKHKHWNLLRIGFNFIIPYVNTIDVSELSTLNTLCTSFKMKSTSHRCPWEINALLLKRYINLALTAIIIQTDTNLSVFI